MANGRGDVPGWSPEIWARIDQAVHAECARTKIAAKFLLPPVMVDANALTVPRDTVRAGLVLDVDPGLTREIVEIQAPFRLTADQVAQAAKESHTTTAVTLATRAANHLCQGEDLLIFQGGDAVAHPLFPTRVQIKSGAPGLGLVNLPNENVAYKNAVNAVGAAAARALNPQVVIIARPAAAAGQGLWRERTFTAVAAAYARLQSGQGLSQAHYGPYALVLHHAPYADTFAPLANTLIMPADRIKPLVTGMADGKTHFHGTGTLPANRGIFVSVGGNTLDLVMARDATTEFMQVDTDGYYRFRVFERFALREKDFSSVIRLEFD